MTFEEQRRAGIGGSDMGSVLNIEPYGCSRRLWYQKQGIEPDHPRKENLFVRGHALEDIVCDWFEQETGARTRRVATVRDPERPYLFCHPDRLVQNVHLAKTAQCQPGDVVEAKTAGREIFHKIKRDGLPEDYIAQAQYNAEIVARETGLEPKTIHFPVLWPDGWVFRLIAVPFDREIGADLAAAAEDWWRAHGNPDNPPDRLPASDKRCQTCEFRTGCQGKRMLEVAEAQGKDVVYADLGDDFSELLDRYQEISEIADEAKAELDELKDRIKARMGDSQAVEVPGHVVTFRASACEGYVVAPHVKRALRIRAK